MLCVVRVFSNVTIIYLYARIGFSPSANWSFFAWASARSLPSVVKYVLIFGSVPDGRTITVAPSSMLLYDEDELPMGGNVLFDLEGNVKRSNDYESISYGGDNGWLCVHNKKTNQTVYLNSDLKTELDLGDAYGAAGDFKKCLRRK